MLRCRLSSEKIRVRLFNFGGRIPTFTHSVKRAPTCQHIPLLNSLLFLSTTMIPMLLGLVPRPVFFKRNTETQHLISRTTQPTFHAFFLRFINILHEHACSNIIDKLRNHFSLCLGTSRSQIFTTSSRISSSRQQTWRADNIQQFIRMGYGSHRGFEVGISTALSRQSMPARFANNQE